MAERQKERLGKLRSGQSGRVVGLVGNTPPAIQRKLMEAGFMEGMSVEVLHEGPVGSDPLAVRVRGALVAIRLADAQFVEVEVGGAP